MKLHVNVDHVATLRQARGTHFPDPTAAAQLAERAGADGITVHLREDRRHIQDADLKKMRTAVVGTFNLEMAATDEMLAIALAVRPDVVTLVPEKREERTTEGGLDLAGARAQVASVLARLLSARIPVSLFIDPDEQSVRTAASLSAPRIELHTGDYCRRFEAEPLSQELGRLVRAARLGAELGLHVAAGHGLAVNNVGPVAAIQEITELNIGHAIVAHAVFIGMEAAVVEMRAAIRESRTGSLRS
jgi:pyridoxine 5-phosphate synthase